MTWWDDLLSLKYIASWKDPVRMATAAALPAYTRVGNVITATAVGAAANVDGVAPAVGDSMLLWHGASGIDNGIWVWKALGSGATKFSLERRWDADEDRDFLSGLSVRVTAGVTYTGAIFRLSTADPVRVNVTAQTYVADTNAMPAPGALDTILKSDGAGAWVVGALNLASAAAVTGILAVANGGTGIGLGAANTVLHVNAGATAIESTLLTTSNLSGTAGILGSQLAAAAAIVGTQLAASANIAASQLNPGGANTVLQGGTPNTWTATPTVTSLTATSSVSAVGDGASATVDVYRYSNDANPAAVNGHKSRGTSGAKVIVNDADVSWRANAKFWDGTQWHTGGSLYFAVSDATPAVGDIGTGLYLTLDAGGGAGSATRLSVLPTAGIFTWDFQAGNLTTTGTLVSTSRLSLTSAAGDYLALGANPADTGAIRLSHAMGVYGESNTPGTDRAGVTWGVVATDTWAVGDVNVATQVNGSTVSLNPASATMIEATEVAAGRRVVSMCLGANLTTTEMPANSGDRVVYVANAATVPTASSVSGGIVYCEGGALKYRGTSGTITTLGAA